MKVYVLLATGFEIAEAMVPIDILKRARVEVQTVSIEDLDVVAASNGIKVLADQKMSQANLSDGDMLFLPGGMPGSINLRDNAGVAKALLDYRKNGKWLSAICAAPMVMGLLGLLKGEKATCFPGFEKDLLEAEVVKQTCVRSGKCITGCGAGAAYALGREMAAALVGEDTADAVLRQMMYQVYE